MSWPTEDLSSFPSTACTSQEDYESNSGSTSSRKLRVTLLSSEWRSTKGSLSTINRELAIQLAKHPSVEVSVYLPQCSEEDKRVAESHNVTVIEAEEMPGLEPDLWLSCLPEDHAVDCVIGHGAILGRQVQIIKRHHHCKWIQVVHTSPEELGMYKKCEGRISKGEKKHQVEVELCKLADQVVAVGSKLAEAFSGYLRPCGKDQHILNITPPIFSEFADVKQASQETSSFSVLVFGRGDSEDFQLKGYDIAAQAIAELKDMTYKLVFVGATGGEEEKVADLLLKQGIDRSQLRVRRFNESREQLAQLFCEVDLAIMPSRTEGFGLAALEALSAGLPVLVSGSSGFGETLKKVPFASSCVIESEDPKEWANAIKAVRHKDREMRLGESKVVRSAYAEKYSWEEQCDKLIERMKIITLEDTSERQQLPEKRVEKRPLPSSNTPVSNYPRLLRDEGRDGLVLVKLLKKEYKRRSQLKPLLWDSTIQLPIEQVYTRLKIVSRRKLGIQMEVDEKESGEEEKDAVNVFDIFKVPDRGEDVMTIVEGSPGIGKTTFCLKLAYDWAHGNIPSECSFPQFEFVFLLKCRDIDGDIMEAISEQLLPRDMEKSVEKLLQFMKDIHNQDRLILIILDGLDELPEKSRHHVDELLYRRILPFCYVLATSRQERGIEARKTFVFDIHLEIKGYTESDSIAYVKRHFQTIGQSPKGERLIEEMQQNTFLHALRNNPLNLLLLCVIFEDYEGNLPTSRTELYQVIVQCLLRRYCAKNSMAVPEDNNTLQERFEEDIFALGQLAWACLLNDRQSFPERKLAEHEVKSPNLIARKIGLLYKEESLKRINPQHEYWFLHKTCQEYLAAAFIMRKLQEGEQSVFEYTTFDVLVGKYPQVFLFVSGMLGEKATVLFTQIGKKLKWKGDWDWNKCSKQAIQFFVESFSESRHAEEMANTLCSYIPFPQQVNIELPHTEGNIFQVLKAFRNVRNLQPVKLTVRESTKPQKFVSCFHRVAEYIQSCSQIQTLSIFIPEMTSALANAVHNGLIGNTTLSEFTQQMSDNIPCDASVAIGELLAARKTLRKVTFHLDRVWGENWASAIETGLSADTSLKSVDLQVRGSMSGSAAHGLGKLLSNKALTSFSLNIIGDMQEWEAAAVCRGIARQTAVRSLDISVNGNLSLSCANALQCSLLENRSLNDLVLTVCGEIPDNWQFVVENLRLVKKGSVNFAFHPDPGSHITYDQVVHFCPAVVEKGLETKQHLTVVLWGELKCDGAEALCDGVLVGSPLTSLRLTVHGKLSHGVASIIDKYFRRQNTLSSLTIDVWNELASETEALLQELSRNNKTVELKVHGPCVVPNEACNALVVSIDNPASLAPVFSEVKNTRKERINLKIINENEVISEWPRLLGDALAENTSLTSLDFTVTNYAITSGIERDLGGRLLRSQSTLTDLNLAISNYSNMADDWECMLINSLAKMASLTTLSLAIDDRGKVRSFGRGLMALKSLSTLSIVINGRNLDIFWRNFLKQSLEQCTVLTKLSLTSNDCAFPMFMNPRDMSVTWEQGLFYGLASTSSLKELVMTFNSIDCAYFPWGGSLIEGLLVNESITSFTITVSDYGHLMCTEWVRSLKRSLAENKSFTALNLTLNDYSEGERHRDRPFVWDPDSIVENTSLTYLNLRVNIRSEVSAEWVTGICDFLMVKCSSLRTVRLEVNNRCSTSKSHFYDFSNLRLKYRSLSTFELSVTFYGE